MTARTWSWCSSIVLATLAVACGDPPASPVPVCGDGVVDPGEACDDGNLSSLDDCLPGCVAATCGDWVVRTSPARPDDREDCDVGGADAIGCDADCTFAACGDHVVNHAAGEVCDDGNVAGADGCSPDCRSDETCGNGIVDDHLPKNRVTAPRECRSAVEQDTGCAEVCDDGNRVSGDGCSENCLSEESCGNGITDRLGDGALNPPEICDDGNDNWCDGCPNHCVSDYPGFFCGDGAVSVCGGEECDRGEHDTDTCNGRANGFAPWACQLSRCGDGHVNAAAGEQCEDGNAVLTDDCVACQRARCGDGVIDLQPPTVEECDFGPQNGAPGASCSAACTLVTPP